MLTKYPNTLNIYLTRLCNLNCQYCFVDKSGPRKKEPDTLSLKNGINFFLRFPGNEKTITFSGGEPFLRFGKIKKLYKYIRHKDTPCNKVVVTSNGTFLTKSRYSFLKQNKIILRISIDGAKEFHDYNRPFRQKRRGSSFKRIANNLKQFYKEDKDYKICATMVFRPGTVENLVENIKALWRMDFGYIDFFHDLYTPWSEHDLKKMDEAFREFADFYISIFENAKETKDVFANSLLNSFAHETGLYKPVFCQKVHLDWKGNFYYCDKVFSLPEPKRKRFIIGNLNTGINNRLRLRLLEQKRKEIKKITGKDCSVCRYRKYCFCPVGHYIYFSSQGLDFKQYFPQFCRASQIYINSFLKIKRNLKRHPLFRRLYGSN